MSSKYIVPPTFWAWFWAVAFMISLMFNVMPSAHADAHQFITDVSSTEPDAGRAAQLGLWVCAELGRGLSDAEVAATVPEYYPEIHSAAAVVSLARNDICPLGW
jgi:hypothetical protein